MNSFNLLVFLTVLIIGDTSPLNGRLGAGCTVTSFDEVKNATSTCTTLIFNSFIVPAGKTLQIDLKAGATVTFQGNITFAKSNWVGPLVIFTGSKVTVQGTIGSVFDGLGAQYWDGKGDLGVVKPKFISVRTTGGSMFNTINLLNCPLQCVLIDNARNTILTNWMIDVSAGDTGALGHNTDGFDFSNSSDITVQNSMVKNQDDCVAINQGMNYIIKNLTCSGGHGLSLSVGLSKQNGTANTVSNVTFSNCLVINSRNAIHVKTHSDGGTGKISKVTYQNIVMSGTTKYGINIQEDYAQGNSTGTPKGNVPITELTMTSIMGTMNGASDSQAVFILCGTNGCGNWTWSGIMIMNSKKKNSCNFTPNGFTC